MTYRIIKRGDLYEIQRPKQKPFFHRLFFLPNPNPDQWETICNPDWAAIFSSKEAALKQLAHWRGEDTDKELVV